MSWRRVAFSVAFAIGATALGRIIPGGLGGSIWLPGTLAASLLPSIKSMRLEISLHIWVWLFTNLSTWALVAEFAMASWSRLRRWEARRDAHA